MIYTVSTVVLIGLAVSCAIAFYRVFKGPSLSDRYVAIDLVGVHVMGIIAMFSIRQGSVHFMDPILSIAVLSFISTVAIAKFIVKGVIIERNNQ